jgi:alkylation response protein AidB-like acyl-CoA dehydrogenase
MDLNYAPEDLAFREATRRWFAEHTPAVEPKTLAERKAWHRTLYDAGFVGMLWPKEYGGQARRRP